MCSIYGVNNELHFYSNKFGWFSPVVEMPKVYYNVYLGFPRGVLRPHHHLEFPVQCTSALFPAIRKSPTPSSNVKTPHLFHSLCLDPWARFWSTLLVGMSKEI